MKTGIKLHNKFDVVVTNLKTGKETKAYAENIVLDRMYTRLCNFQTYFVNIVFGKGSGVPTPDRLTLFERVGSKSATEFEVVEGYPTGQITKKITLGTNEFNGNLITEVGISDTTTQVNTHALLTDAEGNPLSIEKNETTIIDIFATVYIELHDVDSGLFWRTPEEEEGIRGRENLLIYLLGGRSSYLGQLYIGLNGKSDFTAITGTITPDIPNKSVKIEGRFNVNDFNKEVRFLDWGGLRCQLPRTGVYTGTQKTDIILGVGDGVKKVFKIPQFYIKNLIVKVDGITNSSWTRKDSGDIEFDNPVTSGLQVTASYFCTLYPKDENHIIDVSFEIGFGKGKPSPVMPPTPIPNIGPMELVAGDLKAGFYGEAEIDNSDIIEKLELEWLNGTPQNLDTAWLKFSLDGDCVFIPKKPILSNCWTVSNANESKWHEGSKAKISGLNFTASPMTKLTWEKLIVPIHEDFGEFWEYTDEDLQTGANYEGTGRGAWATGGSRRQWNLGNPDVSSNNDGGSFAYRPILTFIPN